MTTETLFGCYNYTNCFLFGNSIEWYWYYLLSFGLCFVLGFFILGVFIMVNQLSNYKNRGKV